MHFRNQVVVVTGAAGGIGQKLCLRLGQEGACLGLIDRDGSRLEKLQDELKHAGVRCATAIADVRDRGQVVSAVETLETTLGATDILVAGAGMCGFAGVDDLKVAELERMLQVNFLGAVYAIEAVLGGMLSRGRGQIVGIASLAAVGPVPFEGAYCASKAALASYLGCLRPTLRRRGVAVTTVFPGFVQTPLLDGLIAVSRARLPPVVMDPETAAKRIISAIRRRARVACFPKPTSWLVHGSRWLPPAIYDWLISGWARRFLCPPETTYRAPTAEGALCDATPAISPSSTSQR